MVQEKALQDVLVRVLWCFSIPHQCFYLDVYYAKRLIHKHKLLIFLGFRTRLHGGSVGGSQYWTIRNIGADPNLFRRYQCLISRSVRIGGFRCLATDRTPGRWLFTTAMPVSE